MKTTNKTTEQHWGRFNNHKLYSSETISELKNEGKRLLSIELIGEDVHVLIWSAFILDNDIKREISLNYHSDSMLLKWLSRSDIEVSEVNYDNYIN